MNVVLIDTYIWDELLPLTFTRPVAEIRIGILTIREKWERWLKKSVSYSTKSHLTKKYPLKLDSTNLFINSALLPDEKIIDTLLRLKEGETYFFDDIFIAALLNYEQSILFIENQIIPNKVQLNEKPFLIEHFCQIFSENGRELEKDYVLLTKNRVSNQLSETNIVIGNRDLIFVEKNAIVEASILNTTTGPIYIGENAEIMEGCMIRGPFAICEHATLKMGAKIYGPTTIGPYSKVGGEVNNSVFFGYSNKAHDGFLGNSVIGEWCNLGADTNNSNLKNNYLKVKMWNYPKQKFVDTGLQFAGLIMGDHSKCGINTMFNTGTVVGVACNLFGDGYHRNFVPSFSWGGPQGYTFYQFDKAIETAKIVLQRRNLTLSQIDIDILNWVYENTKIFRSNFGT